MISSNRLGSQLSNSYNVGTKNFAKIKILLVSLSSRAEYLIEKINFLDSNAPKTYFSEGLKMIASLATIVQGVVVQTTAYEGYFLYFARNGKQSCSPITDLLGIQAG